MCEVDRIGERLKRGRTIRKLFFMKNAMGMEREVRINARVTW